MKVISITEKIKVPYLSDGVYIGTCTDNIVNVNIEEEDEEYELIIEKAIKGTNVNVVVIVESGVAIVKETAN